MIAFLCVFAGGGIGAMARYAISLIPFGTAFPFSTFICNILGAIIIGMFSDFVERTPNGFNPDLQKFVQTGILGGFTTFSTFSLETIKLFDDGQLALGLVYAFASLICCVLGVVIGRAIMRAFILPA